MADTRVLILAAGDGTRWGNYRGVQKHELMIEGEKLIHRTARQFLSYTDDVYIVAKDDSYSYPGTKLFIPQENPEWLDFAKYYCSKELWSEERTILAFGDVYFTDDAIEKIMHDEREICFCFRSAIKSEITGHGPEIFTFAFTGSQHEKVTAHLEQLISNKTPPPGAWRTYRSLVRSFPNPNYECNDLFIDIDDWTTDFDFPEDLDEWEARRAAFLASSSDKI